MSLSKDTVKLDTVNLQGDEVEVQVHSNRSNLDKPVTMTVAGSQSHSGRLWNVTSEFSEDEFSFGKGGGVSDMTHPVKLSLQSLEELKPGNYTLTIGARYDTMTYKKIVNLQVT